MKKLTLITAIILTANLLFGQIIHIPADYPTIQQGIDAANTGDTVLVDTGTYVEHITFNGKNIVVASLYLTTQDTSYISQTTIDGNMNGRVVTFNNQETANAILCGFRIINGYVSSNSGSGILCNGASPVLQNLIVSNNRYICAVCFSNNSSAVLEHSSVVFNQTSGIYCDSSDINLEDVDISNNLSYGMRCDNSKPTLSGVTISHNNGSGIFNHSSDIIFDSIQLCNIYLNGDNTSLGHDLKTDTQMNVYLDTFSVLYPTEYYATPVDSFNFNINTGIIAQINADTYVSPDGDNANSGLTPDDPLKNISTALSLIVSDSTDPHTIFLLEGTYSPYTNEEPKSIHLFDYITISGASQTTVTLDSVSISTKGEGVSISGMTITNRGVYCEDSEIEMQDVTVSNNTGFVGGGIWFESSTGHLKNVKILNNLALYGGGLYFISSEATLENVTISGNTAWWHGDGGGVYCYNSSPVFNNVTISGNTAEGLGGGVFCDKSNPVFNNVIISDNTVTDSLNNNLGYGGGVACIESSPVFYNTLFTGNSAYENGSVLYCEDNSHPELINVTITGNKQYYSYWGTSCALIYSDSYDESTCSILNSVIYANDSLPYSFLDIYYQHLDIDYSNVQRESGVYNGTGNINEDPLFVMSGEHPYQINDNSPCIDAGNPDTTGLNLPEFDLAGELRITNDIVDMGAYEWNLMVGINEEPATSLPDEGGEPATVLKLYPNPVSSELNIETAGKYDRLEIINLTGRVLQSIHCTGASVVKTDMSAFAPGLYMIKLEGENGTSIGKVVKR